MVSLNASVNFGDTVTRMEVVLSSDEQQMVVALFDAQDSPISLGLIMSYFIPGEITLDCIRPSRTDRSLQMPLRSVFHPSSRFCRTSVSAKHP